jgi:neutral ceramidase
VLSAIAAVALAPSLLIRRAEVDISPPELLPLGGYTERHGKLMDPGGDALGARCIELEQGANKVAIVSVDMLTIPESLFREVSSRIPKDVHLFMQATHTHCAPDSQMLNDRMTFTIPGIASFRRRWLEWYADKIAFAVNEAITADGQRASRIESLTMTVKANRARRKGGKPDTTSTRIYAAMPGRLDLLFGHFAAHPIIYGPEENRTRGDWPAVLGHLWGGMVLNGDIGDVSPAADGATADLRMKRFVARFEWAEQYNRTMATAWQGTDKFRWSEQTIRIDPKKPHPSFGKVYGVPPPLAQSLMDQFAPSSGKIVAVRLGSLILVGVPGEPTSILGNQIRAAGESLGFSSVLVCSHVNGWMGYILDRHDYDRGGYEATLSFYGRNEGQKVVDAAIGAMKKLVDRSGLGSSRPGR